MHNIELVFEIVKGKLKCTVYYRSINKNSVYSEQRSIEAAREVLKRHNQASNINKQNGDLIFSLDGEKANVVIKDYKKFMTIESFVLFFNRIEVVRTHNRMPNKVELQKNNKFVKKTMMFLMAGALITTGAVSVKEMNKKSMPEVPVNDATIEQNIAEDNITELAENIETTTNSGMITMIQNTNDRTDSKKAIIARENYEDMISKYCNRYGLDSEVLLAIATQERGVHSSVRDKGGAIGLMQVEVGVWNNESLSVKNVIENKYETINITEEKLSEADFNIKTGCAIFQDCLKKMDGNIFAAIQCYNMGYGNMLKILNSYAKDSGTSVDNILKNNEDLGWLEYRSIINVGDKEYLENVLSYANIDNIAEYYGIEKESLSQITGIKVIKV